MVQKYVLGQFLVLVEIKTHDIMTLTVFSAGHKGVLVKSQKVSADL